MSRSTVRFYFDKDDFVEQTVIRSSRQDAAVYAEERLNCRTWPVEEDAGGVTVVDMQKVRYVRVIPLMSS